MESPLMYLHSNQFKAWQDAGVDMRGCVLQNLDTSYHIPYPENEAFKAIRKK